MRRGIDRSGGRARSPIANNASKKYAGCDRRRLDADEGQLVSKSRGRSQGYCVLGVVEYPPVRREQQKRLDDEPISHENGRIKRVEHIDSPLSGMDLWLMGVSVATKQFAGNYLSCAP